MEGAAPSGQTLEGSWKRSLECASPALRIILGGWEEGVQEMSPFSFPCPQLQPEEEWKGRWREES